MRRVLFARPGAWAATVALASSTACAVLGPPPDPPPPPPPVEGAAGDPAGDPGPEGRLTTPVRSFDEVRALWVVRFTMTSRASVTEMVERAHDAGFNSLIVQVRGRADAFYRSTLEPPGESIREPDLDPLQLTIELAHARGMAVHAWVNTHLVWGPADPPDSPDHLVRAHPEWLAVPRELAREMVAVRPADPAYLERLVTYARANASRVEGVYTSPSDPEVKDRVHAVWMDLASRYDLDGIHFDYIRFPSAGFDYSIGALERFRIWSRGTLPPARFAQLDDAYEADLLAFADGEPELWDAFRREQVTGLVERIHRDVKALKPHLVVSAAVIADPELAYDDRFQEWGRWLAEGTIDVAVPMAYTPDDERFRRLVREARVRATGPDRVWGGIGAYMNSADNTLRMIDIARAEDLGGVVLFSYDWAVGEGRGDPDNPLLVRIGSERFGR